MENLNLQEIKKRLAEAWEEEERDLTKQRELARQMKGDLHKLVEYSASAVAFVAADGGDNRIRLDTGTGGAPATVELVRIVDSNGRECALDAVAGSVDDEFFKDSRLSAIDTLCQGLGFDKVSELSPYLTDNLSRSQKMQVYRDIVEWAVLYKLLTEQDWGSDTLLVREGALRTRAFHKDVFRKLDENIRNACRQHKEKNKVNMFFVGVAKNTILLNRLRFALSLEGVFECDYPCYLKVPRDIAKKFYERRWLDTLETADNREYLSMAEMFLVKFGDHPLDLVWPVDVAAWQVNDAERILAYLAKDSRQGFPIPDFPMCIQKAHDHARIGGIELSYLNDMLFDHVTKKISEKDREKALRARYLQADSTAIRYRHE